MKTQPESIRASGFALVITLALMILLTVIAVGLLSLSSISLRSSAQGEAMAMARSNARLALMLAIGDLQKSLGPDRAVSASSEILTATPAKPHTTGVWESWWDFNPAGSSLDYVGEKSKRFRRWLVSNADPTATASQDFATAAWSGKTIELVGNNTLGGKAATTDKVSAGLVPVVSHANANSKADGAYAWHVADEAAKARINLYRDPNQNTTVAQQRALLAGQRPDPSLIKDADGVLLDCLPTDQNASAFQDAERTSGKLTDLNQVELLDRAKGKIKPLRHDVTTCSLGVLSNVRGGGLKQDLSSAFEINGAATLPSGFPSDFSGGGGGHLYASTPATPGSGGSMIANNASDPNWSTLSSYYNSFRNITDPDGKQAGPAYPATQPESPVNTPVPTRYNPAPVIAKVDTIFSLVARPLYNLAPWISNNNDLTHVCYEYCLNLVFTPVVTLHNPYNVNISFRKMQVTFTNIPVAFQYWFQADGASGFVSQSVVPGTFEPINDMAYRTSNGVDVLRHDKSFVMTIADWSDSTTLTPNSSIKGPIVLKPGQTLVCGPTLPPGSSFDDDTKKGDNAVGFDWLDNLTNNIKATPSFTPGLGYEVYAVTITHIRLDWISTTPIISGNYDYYPGGWAGHPFMFLRDAAANPKQTTSMATDHFYVECKVQRPEWYPADDLNMKCAPATFAVTADLQATEKDQLTRYANLEFDYGDSNSLTYTSSSKPPGIAAANSNLNKIFNDRVYRYPPTGSLTGHEVAAPAGVHYDSQSSYVHPFAIFSAYARTTNGGVYETGKRTKSGTDSPQINLLRDGRLAGKPFLFHNPSRGDFTMNLATDKPGVQAYELNCQPFLSNGDYEDYMNVDTLTGYRVPALTANTTGRGIKSGSYLEVPTGPMQTLADFRRSNALTTSYLPSTVQPVGNSLASPLISTGNVMQPAIAQMYGVPYNGLDHSVLANHALYDRFYFSTFATRGSETPASVFEQFMDGTTPLPSQAFLPHQPGGKSVAAAKAELFSGGTPNGDAFKTAAEYQMVQGPFNVNSTSVQAWKAVLASMNKSHIVTLWPKTDQIESKAATGVPILGMSMLNGGVTGGTVDATKIDDNKTNDWNGHRELTDKELEALATSIVGEVRSRGPFLSLSEFVNRQVGPNGPLTQRGALEAAITDSKINDNFLKPYVTNIELSDISDPKVYNYNTPDVVTGNPAAGAPGWISQGDLMRILEPAATVHGDTFVIRVCGEAWDPNGKVTARAYAEAVVQRMPEYVDPADRPSVNAYTDASAAKSNRTFGRRFNLVSFRWLSGNEI